jgi:hypothetical protein
VVVVVVGGGGGCGGGYGGDVTTSGVSNRRYISPSAADVTVSNDLRGIQKFM